MRNTLRLTLFSVLLSVLLLAMSVDAGTTGNVFASSVSSPASQNASSQTTLLSPQSNELRSNRFSGGGSCYWCYRRGYWRGYWQGYRAGYWAGMQNCSPWYFRRGHHRFH